MSCRLVGRYVEAATCQPASHLSRMSFPFKRSGAAAWTDRRDRDPHGKRSLTSHHPSSTLSVLCLLPSQLWNRTNRRTDRSIAPTMLQLLTTCSPVLLSLARQYPHEESQNESEELPWSEQRYRQDIPDRNPSRTVPISRGILA